MPRMTIVGSGTEEIPIDEALRLRDAAKRRGGARPQFHCVKCGNPVRAHAAGIGHAGPRTLRLRGLRAARRAVGRTPADYELLFRSSRGTRVSYDALHYQWAKLCASAGLVDAAGMPRYTPHQLRHTRGSELIAQGQRVEIVQRVLGHRDIRSTLGYAELQEAQVRAALERVTPR